MLYLDRLAIYIFITKEYLSITDAMESCGKEAEEIIRTWKELNPGYQPERFEQHPEGFAVNGVNIPGRKHRNEEESEPKI